jgi:hypothetical protein
LEDGASYWPTVGGNPSGNNTAVLQCPCLLQTTGSPDPQMLYRTSSSWNERLESQKKYLIMTGDSGLGVHNVGQLFNLSTQTQAAALIQSGNTVVTRRVSSVTDMNDALTSNGSNCQSYSWTPEPLPETKSAKVYIRVDMLSIPPYSVG